MLVFMFGSNHFRLFQAWYLIPHMLIFFFYYIYLVKRYGGTPGKLILGIKIAKVDGSKVGYEQAIFRALPEFILNTIMAVALVIATFQITDQEYLSLEMVGRTQYLKSIAPPWAAPLEMMQFIWVMSEFIVLLTNDKKRALHDFIAGTIVMRKDSEQVV